MNIEELLPDGEWVSEDEYVVRCPFCGDHPTHNHCHVNPVKGVFFCHFGGDKGSIGRLLKEYKVVGELEPRKEIIEKRKFESTNFLQFPKVTGRSGTLDLLALTYLRRRGLSKEEIELYDIRFTVSERYYGRVLMPIYENNRLVSFAARSLMSCIKPKYLYPRTGETLLTKSEAMFGYEEASAGGCSAVLITEGIFDAIAANRIVGLRGLAILSKYLSEGQLYKLLKLPRNITYFVALDSDAHEDAVKVARKIGAYEREIKLVFLREGDPASVTGAELIEALGAAELFSGNEVEIRLRKALEK